MSTLNQPSRQIQAASSRSRWSFSASEISAYYRERVPKLKQRGREWRGPCPVHQGKNDSFAVNPETGAAYCHSKCGRGWSIVELEQELGGGTRKEAAERIRRLVGRPEEPRRPRRRQVAAYDYVDEDGKLLFQVVRYEPKDFRQRRPDGKGGWTWGVKGVRLAPYRLPRVLGAQRVLVVEGEKDVHALERLGYVATCNPMGAGKWREEFAEYLAGREVIILPDNDVAGEQHARQVARTLDGKARSIRIVRLPDVGPGGDISDWITAGGTKEKLEELIGQAAEYKPDEQPQQEAAPGPPSLDQFTVDQSGLWAFHPKSEDYEWIAPPVEILAGTMDYSDENVGKLVRYRDHRGRERISVIPHTKLVQDGNEAIEEMVRCGFKPHRGRWHRERLKDYIWITEPKRIVRCVDQVGWYHRRYVMPDGTIGEPADEIVFHSEVAGAHKLQVSGTLDEWRQHVARLCAGNSRLAFCVSAAFAAAMLTPLRHECVGFHFRGQSSTGKTTALLAAGSVWGGDPRRGFLESWRSTANGLEAAAALHNDSLLCLDEISQASEKDIGEMVYMLGNGTTKRRMTRSITARRTMEYTLIYLSTGERRLSEIMRVAGRQTKAGQELRLIEIDAESSSGLGMFDKLHEFRRPGEFARALGAAAREYYGAPIREFLRRVAAGYDEARDFVRKMQEQFVMAHVPEGASGEVQRVAATFGLVAGAGELATRYSITGWQEGEARTAARICYLNWLDVRGSFGPLDIEYGIQAVREFIARYGASRFIHRWASKEDAERVRDLAGFVEATQNGDLEKLHTYYILSEVFQKDICGSYEYRAVYNEMIRRGYGEKCGGERNLAKQLRTGLGKRRVFVILPALFEEE